jgi:hypothetical protein
MLSDNFKNCFNCGRKYPLFLFKKNNRKYQRPQMKNRVYNCRFCEATICYKKEKEIRLIDGKFEVIHFEPTIFNWLKKFTE